MTDMSGPVVVGYDGSEGATLALEWAAVEAAALHAPLHLVYAYRDDDSYALVARQGRLATREADLVQSAARRLVADGADAVARLGIGVATSTTAYDDDALTALLDIARDASVLVVGSRRLGPIGSVLLGSTSSAIAAHAPCPVVVVRGRAGDPAARAGVVIGVDPHDRNEDVVEFGFQYADRHGAPVRPVLCWHSDPVAETSWGTERPAPQHAENLLGEALADARRRYPAVDVSPAVIRARPVPGLLAESTAERLLVVGARGRHAVAGTLLGSVSQGVLHHATCPVAVIPVGTASP